MNRFTTVIFATMAVLATGFVVGCHQKTPDVIPNPTLNSPPQSSTQPAPTTQLAEHPKSTPQESSVQIPAGKPVEPLPVQPTVSIIASMDNVQIPYDMVQRLVMESHGLNMLLRIMQVELSKASVIEQGLTVTADDVRKEREMTLDGITKEATQKLRDDIAEAREKKNDALVAKLQAELVKDQEAMLQQLLTREKMTMGEFELLMESNTNIRAIVEKQIDGKITEDNVHEAFMNLYGENVRVRHIQLANMAEVSEAQRRIAAGESFEAVARSMSRNAGNRNLGGELPPFSRETQGLPDSFKQVAFTLKKPGEISEPVEANGSYHLIRLTERIAPRAIKFESVKDTVRQQLHDRWVTERMKVYRDQLAKKVMEGLKITDPVLSQQFRDRVLKRENEMKERDQISRQLANEREAMARAAAEAATRPAATTKPVMTEEGTIPLNEEVQPPAARSGSNTPDTQPTTSPQKP